MSTTTATESAALQTVSQAAIADTGRMQSSNMLLDANTMDMAMRVAELMSNGKSTIPAHLQKNPADCMAVVLQSMQWGMMPFAVAQKTHIVNGTLGYEAQLVNAVVQQSGLIDGRFHYDYKGTSPNMECRVGAKFKGEAEIVWGNWLSESKVTTKNSPLWKVNPQQQLGYLQVKNWARLFCPGAILGVYTPDELQEAPTNKFMGPAQQVAPAVPDALLAQANTAAALGVAEYQKFWKGTGQDNRKLLAVEHERLKIAAIEADASRTVDQDTGEVTQKQATVAQAAPVEVTYESVLAKLNAAKNEDALNVAADWINEVENPVNQGLLNARYDELLGKMRGGA